MTHTSNLYEAFRRQVETRGEATAIIDGTAPDEPLRRLTFSDLDNMASSIRSLFPTPTPRRVGVIIEHGALQIATLLACRAAGAAYVPAEPSFPPARIAYMMRQSEVDFIVAGAHTALPRKDLKGIPVVRISDKKIAKATISMPPSPSANPEAYILYTSGTTGKPKGVRISDDNVLHYTAAFEDEFHIGPGDVMMQYSVCSFDIFTEEVWCSLLNGAALAIPPANIRNDMRRLMAFASDAGVTIISGFPYLLLELNKLPELPSSLRLLISGGDVLRASYVDRLADRITVYNTYGPSETTVCATYYNCSRGKALPDGTYPIGHPVKGTQVALADDGELLIYGDGVGMGYVGNPPEQANYFTDDNGRRAYRSGDLGYILPDGNLGFTRRKDSQVMIGGKRVECGEVENVLNRCRGVENAVVSAYTDAKGLSYLVAYIVPRVKGFSLQAVKRSLRRSLTAFMIPEFFVSLRSMPVTSNGKVDRQALPVILKESDYD